MRTAKRPNIGLAGAHACITNQSTARQPPRRYGDASALLHPLCEHFSFLFHTPFMEKSDATDRSAASRLFPPTQGGEHTFALFRCSNTGSHSLGRRWKLSLYEKAMDHAFVRHREKNTVTPSAVFTKAFLRDSGIQRETPRA